MERLIHLAFMHADRFFQIVKIVQLPVFQHEARITELTDLIHRVIHHDRA